MDDKIKILIASVLKPADDVRSCYKIGQSLAQTNKYEVNIIGFNSKKTANHENIFLFPIFNFKRNSIKRFLAPFSVLKLYIQLKPKLIIVNTPELLWVIFLIRILFGTKIIYDIQENYRFNLKQNQIYNGLAKYAASLFVHINESLSKYFVDGFFLAEDIYEKQLGFIRKKLYINLLNKSVIPIRQIKDPINFEKKQFLKFIYTGTIGKEYGTIEAIQFYKKLRKKTSDITLTIIGYSTDNQYLNLVKKASKNIKGIRLITADKPIPQSDIIAEIETCNIALLPYHLNPNISGRFPTKIYDYLALAIPMIIPRNPSWEDYIAPYHAALSIDFNKPDLDKFMQHLYSSTFYLKHVGEEIQWQNQDKDLLNFISKILTK